MTEPMECSKNVKKMCIVAIGCVELKCYNAIKCVFMSNQECKIRPIIVNIYSNGPLFYPIVLL